MDNLKPNGAAYNRESVYARSIDRCAEYSKLKEDRPALAAKLIQLDTLLENLLTECSEYDRVSSKEDKESEWGVKILRCRLVLGMD